MTAEHQRVVIALVRGPFFAVRDDGLVRFKAQVVLFDLVLPVAEAVQHIERHVLVVLLAPPSVIQQVAFLIDVILTPIFLFDFGYRLFSAATLAGGDGR